jgi:transcriptional regulator GlxA family with amidase domain
MLAVVAGLSVHHFERQSGRATPHVYLTQKRVERAQEMLIQTGLSVRGNCVRGRLFSKVI